MKKACWILITLFLGVIQPFTGSFAQSLEPSFPQNFSLNNQTEQPVRLGSTSDVRMTADNFGGYLYHYNDEQGNRCVTNSTDLIIKGLIVADATESMLSGDVPVNEPLILLKLEESEDVAPESLETDDPPVTPSDPFEPINRAFFHFNDKLYFWFFKPVATGYSAVVPEPARVSVRNFFKNLTFPIRFINCLLQAKLDGAGNELGRFMVNSTVGLAGFFDVAKKYDITAQDEDLGQTLGSYGIGSAFYINWPIFGPSSLRDTFGMVGDSFLDPLNYMVPRGKYNMTIKGYKGVNKTSLVIGDYEDLKRSALDPYIAVRDAYFQHRQNKIKE